MVDYQERRRLIRESLKIQPLSHGQIYTYTVGMRSQPEISPERCEELRWSLENHKSNLIPIVVRRTENLGDDKEYEVIYGADWVKVAEDVGIETLWAWVFDLTDEEAIATRDEMAMVLDTPAASQKTIGESDRPSPPFSLADISRLLDHKLDSKLTQLSTQLVTELVPESVANSAPDSVTRDQAISALESQIKSLAEKVETLMQKIETLNTQSPSRQSKSKTLKSIDELKAELERFRAGDASVSAEMLREDLSHRKVVANDLKKLAEDLQLPGYSKLPKKITKPKLLDFLLTC